jgi:molybdate transport system permease protein
VNDGRARVEKVVVALTGGALAVFLALPVFALLLTISGQDFSAGLAHPLVWPALRLSLTTTAVTVLLVVLLGTPLAWSLSRSSGRFVRALEIVVGMPIVVPPAVAGVALLLAFGRRGWLGAVLPPALAPSFTVIAVVMAQVFVSAPFFLQAAISAFRRLDAKLLLAARSFGASPLRILLRIALPLARPGLIAGAAMTWARALGEFGATLMFAGNLQGETQTLPLAIYTALESDLRAAQALSIILVLVAFAALLVVRSSVGVDDNRGSSP